MSETRLTVNHYREMLEAVRNWMETDHPEARYATVIVEIGDDLPAIQVPIIQRDELVS